MRKYEQFTSLSFFDEKQQTAARKTRLGSNSLLAARLDKFLLVARSPARHLKAAMTRAGCAASVALHPIDWCTVTSAPACTVRQTFEIETERAGRLVFEADAGIPLQATIRELIDGRCYLPSELERRLPPRPVVVDVGANIGVFSIWASRFLNAEVVAIEPVPRNLHWLRHNLALNRAENVTVVAAALASTSGRVSMQVPHQSVGAHLCSESVGAVAVDGLAPDDLFRAAGVSRVDLMKLDCEGAEYDIFSTISPERLALVANIAMEYHDLDRHRNWHLIRGVLEHAGFTVKVTRDRLRSSLGYIVAMRDGEAPIR